MNERILEFAIEARKYAETKPDIYSVAYDKKFAELIVRECAKVAYKYAADSVNYEHYDDIGWDCLPVDLRSYIKEHFGVEE